MVHLLSSCGEEGEFEGKKESAMANEVVRALEALQTASHSFWLQHLAVNCDEQGAWRSRRPTCKRHTARHTREQQFLFYLFILPTGVVTTLSCFSSIISRHLCVSCRYGCPRLCQVWVSTWRHGCVGVKWELLPLSYCRRFSSVWRRADARIACEARRASETVFRGIRPLTSFPNVHVLT